MTARWDQGVLAKGTAAIRLIGHARHPVARSVVVSSEPTPSVGVQLTLPPSAATVMSPDAVLDGSADLPPDAHVVVDASALPEALNLAVLTRLLDAERASTFGGQLQVLVSAPAGAGPAPSGSAIELTTMTPGRAGTCRERPGDAVNLWIPVLSGGGMEELAHVHALLEPDEICPVLPFPASNPRLADELVLEHRSFLFERIQFDLRNIVYAHENDPFDLYRTVTILQARHARALDPLAASEVAVSPGHSTLMALGAFLAAYELGLPIVWSPRPRSTPPVQTVGRNAAEAALTCVWLAGDPYRRSGAGPS